MSTPRRIDVLGHRFKLLTVERMLELVEGEWHRRLAVLKQRHADEGADAERIKYELDDLHEQRGLSTLLARSVFSIEGARAILLAAAEENGVDPASLELSEIGLMRMTTLATQLLGEPEPGRPRNPPAAGAPTTATPAT